MLGRFIQADTLVPGSSPQALNRYAYVLNNPLRFVDPTGHWWEDPDTGALIPRPPVYWVYGDSARDIGEVHQWQGDRTNDCGPTALATTMGLASRKAGEPMNVMAPSVAGSMQNLSGLLGIHHYRLTSTASWLNRNLFDRDAGDITGATPPWGMARAYTMYAEAFASAGLPGIGTASWGNHASKQDLIDNMKSGILTPIELNWNDRGAHWVNVVGYNEGADTFYLMDPGRQASELGPRHNVVARSWDALQLDWSRALVLPLHEPLQNAMVEYDN